MPADDFKGLREALAAHGKAELFMRTNRHPETDGRRWGWVSTSPPGAGNDTVRTEWTEGEKSECRARLIVQAVNSAAALLAELDRTRAERDALREDAIKLGDALRALLEDSQHKSHADCEDGGYCPVRDAREALREWDAAIDSSRGKGKEAGNG